MKLLFVDDRFHPSKKPFFGPGISSSKIVVFFVFPVTDRDDKANGEEEEDQGRLDLHEPQRITAETW